MEKAVNIAELRTDSEFKLLAREAQNKTYWSYAWTGVTAVTGLITATILGGAFLPFLPALEGGALAINAGMAGLATATSWFQADSMRDESKAAQEKLANFLEKKSEGKTDTDIAQRVDALEKKVDAAEHGQASTHWQDRTESAKQNKPWRQFIAENTVDQGASLKH